jgi:hypothetical protein
MPLSIPSADGPEALRAILDADPEHYPLAIIRRDDGKPYLHRYYVASRGGDTDGPSIYIHRIVSSDPEGLHDHPWDARSVILFGRYIELRAGGAVRILEAGDVNVIAAADFHRILIEPGREAWTLFFHGPRQKEWGFLDERTGAYREMLGRTRDKIGA